MRGETAVQTLKGPGEAGSRVSGRLIGGSKGCNFAKSNKSTEESGDFWVWARRGKTREQVWASLV